MSVTCIALVWVFVEVSEYYDMSSIKQIIVFPQVNCDLVVTLSGGGCGFGLVSNCQKIIYMAPQKLSSDYMDTNKKVMLGP